jgi:hypothetical protein
MSLIILINCIAMAMERPSIADGSQEAEVLSALDIAFTVVFGVEALLKIVAFSFRCVCGREEGGCLEEQEAVAVVVARGWWLG